MLRGAHELDDAIAERARPQWHEKACYRKNLGGRGHRGGGGKRYLLNYAQGTYTRASEAAFYDPRSGLFLASGAAAWKATNVPRILGDGSYLTEEARENTVAYSADLSQWTPGGTPTRTGAQPAPDGGADAYRVQFDAINELIDRLLTAAPADNALAVMSGFGRLHDAGSPDFWLVTKAGAIQNYGTSFGASWGRFDQSVNVGAGASVPVFRFIQGNATARNFDAWGVQFELTGDYGQHPTSPIRTAGAAATRAASMMQFSFASVPAAIKSGVWSIDVWPSYASTSADMGGQWHSIYAGDSNSSLVLRYSAGIAMATRIGGTGGLSGTSTGLTWSRWQKLTFITNEVAKTVTVRGCTAGDQTFAFSENLALTGPLSIGNQSGVRPFGGVVGRPYV